MAEKAGLCGDEDGGRETQELAKFRGGGGGGARRAGRSQDASMGSETGSEDAVRAWRSACSSVPIHTTVSRLSRAWFRPNIDVYRAVGIGALSKVDSILLVAQDVVCLIVCPL